MFRFRSITTRLVFLHVLVVIIAAIFIPFMLFWLLDSDVDSLQQNALKQQAESIARNLSRNSEGKLSLDLPSGLRHQYSDAYGRYSYVVLDSSGTVLFASSPSRKPIIPFVEQRAEVRFFESAGQQHNIVGTSLRRVVGGQTLYLQVAENINHRDVLLDDVVRDFFQRAALVTAPILLVLLLIDIFIFRRALQPILQASDQASQISPARLDLRLTIKEIPQEIASLVAAVNQALDRLELGFRRQQEFAADAAHELRTPLAILRARVETLQDRKFGAALLHDIDSMTRTIGQLLDAAEIESIVIDPGEVADLRSVSREIAEFIAPLALSEQKSIALTGTEQSVFVKGNSEMLRRAIRNLVENAIKHTPVGTAVEIRVDEDGSVSVSDTGEGVAASDREKIFERRLKGDANMLSAEGAGLGLSIVKRIVEAHGGRILLDSNENGGARFTIHLMPASVAQHPAT